MIQRLSEEEVLRRIEEREAPRRAKEAEQFRRRNIVAAACRVDMCADCGGELYDVPKRFSGRLWMDGGGKRCGTCSKPYEFRSGVWTE